MASFIWAPVSSIGNEYKNAQLAFLFLLIWFQISPSQFDSPLKLFGIVSMQFLKVLALMENKFLITHLNFGDEALGGLIDRSLLIVGRVSILNI